MDNPSNQENLSTWRAPDKGRFRANCDAAIPASRLRSNGASCASKLERKDCGWLCKV
ncbi:hypothetical protein RHMOL_Rhmol01G0176700 [Rhododendron molle]|uniref:Uncharacterized protein n=1 Tax=Rhododendron molle TaxID=49168 RepID=A0ACC0Q457_RHOML|nr:hypothetical protein RHMOL_Rhmol01G0176700 [Rhododendron molle]